MRRLFVGLGGLSVGDCDDAGSCSAHVQRGQVCPFVGDRIVSFDGVQIVSTVVASYGYQTVAEQTGRHCVSFA